LYKLKSLFTKYVPTVFKVFRGINSTIVAIDFRKIIDTFNEDYFYFQGKAPLIKNTQNLLAFNKEVKEIELSSEYLFVPIKILPNNKDNKIDNNVENHTESDTYKLISKMINYETKKRLPKSIEKPTKKRKIST
jgi:hypothetical protein